MIWVDLFLQLFVQALAWCVAGLVSLGGLIVGAKVFVWACNLADRPRVVKPGRSRWTGGLS